MDERLNKIASLANIAAYNSEATKDYIDGAPHVKHESIRNLYGQLILQVFDEAKKHRTIPKVLDLGAGEGSVTLPFLELGAKVVATDISSSQLASLQNKCKRFGELLETRCEDMNDTFNNLTEKYDIVVVNSFLHHVPDYLGMIKQAINVLEPNGQFFSFQDPMRYNSIGKPALYFSSLGYFSWRIFKGDLIGGLKTRIRRVRGVYLDDSARDNAEYHVVRNGVDQDAICHLFREQCFGCTIYKYFSTQSSFFQAFGESFGIQNTFAIIAKKNVE